MKVISSEFVQSAAALSGAPALGLPEVAFAGRSNVGKSSLINALLGRRKLARVSNTPGRTRLLNFFRVTVEPAPRERVVLGLCDLPGYGYAKAPREEVSRWRAMIETYLRGRPELTHVVTLLDIRHPPTEGDRTLQGWLREIGRAPLIVVTKIDKLSKAQRTPALRALGQDLGGTPLGCSAETGEGIDLLWERLLV